MWAGVGVGRFAQEDRFDAPPEPLAFPEPEASAAGSSGGQVTGQGYTIFLCYDFRGLEEKRPEEY